MVELNNILTMKVAIHGSSMVGHNLLIILTSSGGSYANESLTLREVIGNSSFSFDLLEQTGIANSTTVWGLGNIQNMSWKSFRWTTNLGR